MLDVKSPVLAVNSVQQENTFMRGTISSTGVQILSHLACENDTGILLKDVFFPVRVKRFLLTKKTPFSFPQRGKVQDVAA